MSYEQSRQDDLYDADMERVGKKLRRASDFELVLWSGQPAEVVRQWAEDETHEFDCLCHDLVVGGV